MAFNFDEEWDKLESGGAPDQPEEEEDEKESDGDFNFDAAWDDAPEAKVAVDDSGDPKINTGDRTAEIRKKHSAIAAANREGLAEKYGLDLDDDMDQGGMAGLMVDEDSNQFTEGVRDVQRNTMTGAGLMLSEFGDTWKRGTSLSQTEAQAELELSDAEIQLKAYRAGRSPEDYRKMLQDIVETGEVSKENRTLIERGLSKAAPKMKSSGDKLLEVAQDPNASWAYDPSMAPKTFLDKLIRTTPQIIGQVGVGVATGGLGSGAFMFTQIAGGEYENLRKEGVKHDRAVSASFVSALIQTPLEMIGGVGKAHKAFKSKSVVVNKLKRLVANGFSEGVTEFIQEYPSAAAEIWSKDPDIGKLEALGEALTDGETFMQGLESGAIGAIMGGGTHFASFATSQSKDHKESVEEAAYAKLSKDKQKQVDDSGGTIRATDLVDRKSTEQQVFEQEEAERRASEGLPVDDPFSTFAEKEASAESVQPELRTTEEFNSGVTAKEDVETKQKQKDLDQAKRQRARIREQADNAEQAAVLINQQVDQKLLEKERQKEVHNRARIQQKERQDFMGDIASPAGVMSKTSVVLKPVEQFGTPEQKAMVAPLREAHKNLATGEESIPKLANTLYLLEDMEQSGEISNANYKVQNLHYRLRELVADRIGQVQEQKRIELMRKQTGMDRPKSGQVSTNVMKDVDEQARTAKIVQTQSKAKAKAAGTRTATQKAADLVPGTSTGVSKQDALKNRLKVRAEKKKSRGKQLAHLAGVRGKKAGTQGERYSRPFGSSFNFRSKLRREKAEASTYTREQRKKFNTKAGKQQAAKNWEKFKKGPSTGRRIPRDLQAAIRLPDGQVMLGNSHFDIMGNIPEKVMAEIDFRKLERGFYTRDDGGFFSNDDTQKRYGVRKSVELEKARDLQDKADKGEKESGVRYLRKNENWTDIFRKPKTSKKETLDEREQLRELFTENIKSGKIKPGEGIRWGEAGELIDMVVNDAVPTSKGYRDLHVDEVASDQHVTSAYGKLGRRVVGFVYPKGTVFMPEPGTRAANPTKGLEGVRIILPGLGMRSYSAVKKNLERLGPKALDKTRYKRGREATEKLVDMLGHAIKAQQRLDEVAAKSNLGRYEIVESWDQLPDNLQAGAKEAKARGLFDPDTGIKYVIADQHVDYVHMLETAWHELGHFSLRDLAEKGQVAKDLSDVLEKTDQAYSKEVDDFLDRYGLSDRVEAQEEVLVDKFLENKSPTVKRRMQAFLNKLATKIFDADAKDFSDVAVAGIVKRMRENLASGQPAAPSKGTTKYSRGIAALKQGGLDKDQIAYIEAVMEAMPETYREHFDVITSKEKGTVEMKVEKIGEMKEDGKHVVTLFKDGDVGHFLEKFGEFAAERLLKKGEAKKYFLQWKEANPDVKIKKEEWKQWFGKSYAEWEMGRTSKPGYLTRAFNRITRALKAIYVRYAPFKNIAPEVETMFEDLATGKRDIVTKKYFYSDKAIMDRYLFGVEPSPTERASQGFSTNNKTLHSYDPGNICPKTEEFAKWLEIQVKEKNISLKDLTSKDVWVELMDGARKEGYDVPCSYCYVEQTRREAVIFHNNNRAKTAVDFTKAKTMVTAIPYTDYLLQRKKAGKNKGEYVFTDEMVAEANAAGGLRMFSFSDYIRHAHRAQIELLMEHAKKRGLSLKAITKRPEFVEDFAHTGITINMSIDDEGTGMDISRAKQLQKQYPNAKIRTVAKNVKDAVKIHKEGLVDLITLWHGTKSDRPTAEYENMSYKHNNVQQMLEENPEMWTKTCCLNEAKCYNGKKKTQCLANCAAGAGNLSIPNIQTAEEAIAEVENKKSPEAKEVRYSRMANYNPKKTVKAYKLVNVGKDGQIYPLFVNAKTPFEMGVWLKADTGELTSKGKVKSKIGPLAFRPGWHSGDLPLATHIGGRKKGEKIPSFRKPEQIWVEIEVPADVDWQAEANKRAKKTKDGKIIGRTAHITDQLPEGGYYNYRTNENMTGSWLISGEMKINRILSDKEVDAINNEANTADLPRLEPMVKVDQKKIVQPRASEEVTLNDQLEKDRENGILASYMDYIAAIPDALEPDVAKKIKGQVDYGMKKKFKELYDWAKKSGVKFTYKNGEPSLSDTANAYFDTRKNEIVFNLNTLAKQSKASIQTVGAHEIVHAMAMHSATKWATAKRFSKYDKMQRDLANFVYDLKDAMAGTGAFKKPITLTSAFEEQGTQPHPKALAAIKIATRGMPRDLSMLEELLTYGLTQPEFASWLDSIKVPESMKKGKQGSLWETMWDRFKDIMRNIVKIHLPNLNTKVDGETMYDRLNDIFRDMIEGEVGPVTEDRPALKFEDESGSDFDYLAENVRYSRGDQYYHKAIGPRAKIKEDTNLMDLGIKDKIITGMVDSLRPLLVMENGMDIAPGMSGYKSMNMLSNFPSIYSVFMQHGGVYYNKETQWIGFDPKSKGLEDIVKSLGEDVDPFFDWMTALSAKELIADGRTGLFGNVEKDGVQVSDEQIVNDILENSKPTKEWHTAREDLRKMNKAVLDFAQDSGMINAEARAEWERFDYIPFYRLKEDPFDTDLTQMIPKAGGDLNVIRKLKGSDKNLGDPLVNLMQGYSMILNGSLKNVARKKSLLLALNTDLVTKVDEVPSDKKGHVVIRHEGNPQYFKVNDKALYAAMVDLDTMYEGWAQKALSIAGAPKRWLTAGVTVAPAFRVANFIRDTFNTTFMAEGFIPVWDSAIGAYHSWKQTDAFKQYAEQGGAFSGAYHNRDIYGGGTINEKEVQRLKKKMQGKGKALGFWRRVGEASENAARVGAFLRKKKKGATTFDAAYDSKDLLDFHKHGKWAVTRAAIQTLPFLNARLQGLYKLGRTGMSKKTAGRFVLSGMMYTLSTMALLMSYDEEDRERFKKLPDHEKRMYHHFWIGDSHYRIPIPFEVGSIFGVLPTTLTEWMWGDKDFEDVVKQGKEVITDTFAFNPVPQFMKPFVEWWANKDSFTGRETVPQHQRNLPPKLQYDDKTSRLMIEIGKVASHIPGVKEYASPAKMDKFMRDTTSYFWTATKHLTDIGLAHMMNYPKDPAGVNTDRMMNLLGVQRFRHDSALEARYTRQTEKFYELKKEADRIWAEHAAYMKIRERERARSFKQEHLPEMKISKRFRKVQRQLSKINQKISLTVRSRKMSPEEKRDEINRLIKQRNDKIDRALQKAKEFKK